MFNQVPPALPPGFAPHDLPPRPASAFGPNNVPPRYTSTPLSQHAPTFEPRAQSGGVNSSSASPNSRRRADSDSPGDLSTARPPIPAPAPVDIPTRYAQLQKQYKAVTSELAALAHEIPEDSFIYREIANALRNYPEDTLPALSQVKYHFWQLDHEIKKFFVNLEKHKDNFEKYKAYVEKYKDNEELRLRCMGHRDEARCVAELHTKLTYQRVQQGSQLHGPFTQDCALCFRLLPSQGASRAPLDHTTCSRSHCRS